MNIIITISTLFVIGSVFGYILEVLYRRIFSRKKWMNPGFLTGPYLPIYGVGVVLLYAISNINFPFQHDIPVLNMVIKILMIGISLTLVELVIGLICVKGFKVRLWDYSHIKGNYKGIICPIYSLFWLIGGSLYYFLINPLLVDAIHYIDHNLVYSFFIGIVIGMIIVDFAYSIHLLTKLKDYQEYHHLHFDEFRKVFKDKVKRVMRREKQNN